MSSTPGKPSSRSQALCLILGKSEDLKRNVLPTTKDLLKYYLHVKHASSKEKPTGLISKILDLVVQMGNQSCVNRVKTPCD